MWLFQGDQCKGSARSIDGFDVTDAMSSCNDLFAKFGGHKAAGGFSFDPKMKRLSKSLVEYTSSIKESNPMFGFKIDFDCRIDKELLSLEL